jgi:diguanylate cyclase (GGDEF)-like protein
MSTHETDSSLTRADRWSALLIGGFFVACAVVLAILAANRLSGVRLGALVVLIGLYAVAFNTEFESRAGSAVPTEPVLVGLLFLVPLGFVPLAVLLGQTVAIPGKGPRRTAHQFLVSAIPGWHCLGPVAVLAFADLGPPALHHWPIYVLALAAQYILDITSGCLRAYVLGISAREMVGPFSWTFLVDFLLAPLGLSAVLAADGSASALWFITATIGLVRILAHDRRRTFDRVHTLDVAVEQAREEARIDPLTQLSNRRAWRDAIADAADAFDANRSATTVTVMFVDLDRLKLANDTLGHEAGDQLICAMARCLVDIAPPDATVARLGGDEFGLLLVEPVDATSRHQLIERIRERVEAEPMVADFRLSASVGVASCPPEKDPSIALRVADERAFADKLSRRANR